MTINNVKPYNQEEAKTSQLRRMFNTISGKYDKFNDIMSLGLARIWRKKALKSLVPYKPQQILDIAAGTADLSIKAAELLQPQNITGIDISEQMLEVGRKKVEAAGLSDRITLQVEDASEMSFADASFDAVTISFGVRNFEKLDKSLTEIHRVLKPGGKLVILEMSEPKTPVIKQGYLIYTKTLIPFAVKTFSNDPNAYSYLTESMEVFPQGKEFIGILAKNRFKILKHRTFFMGVCSLYVSEKE